jgi:phenylpropionate dioxygenase-like ring-hydroxylating dioxygenase large terminal subunit
VSLSQLGVWTRRPLQTARLMGADFDKTTHGTIPVWVEQWNGMIFINLSREAPRPVAELLKAANFEASALQDTKVVLDRT